MCSEVLLIRGVGGLEEEDGLRGEEEGGDVEEGVGGEEDEGVDEDGGIDCGCELWALGQLGGSKGKGGEGRLWEVGGWGWGTNYPDSGLGDYGGACGGLVVCQMEVEVEVGDERDIYRGLN